VLFASPGSCGLPFRRGSLLGARYRPTSMAEPTGPESGRPTLKLNGFGGMTLAEVRAVIGAGGRIVVFPYAESWIVVSFRRMSKPTLRRPEDHALRLGAVQILHSLLFGWWGFPWGPIYTVSSIWQCARGGIDVTQDVMTDLEMLFRDRTLEPVAGR
jgi:hypothetical protein